MGEVRNMHKIWVRKPDGKRPLSTSTWTWMENNIQMARKGVQCENMDWIYLSQNRVL